MERYSMSRYNYNKNYFLTIDTPAKAYWFGFLCADGSITRFYAGEKLRSMSLELTVKSDDEGHLHKYLSAIESNTPIQYRDTYLKATDKVYKSCRSVVNNTHLCWTLINHGCTPCKSLNLKFPDEQDVPMQLISHFMRGYFDGDGCIAQYDTKRQKTTVWTLCGTKDFLDHYASILIDNGICVNTLATPDRRGEQIYELRIHGLSNIHNIMEFLYRDSDESIRLDRKYEVYQSMNFNDGRASANKQRCAS